MYARVTTYQADPARVEELRAKLPQIKDKLVEMDGLLDWYTAWRGRAGCRLHRIQGQVVGGRHR